MPVINKAKFNIGDIVEDKSGLRGMIYTTEKAEGLRQADSVFSEMLAIEYYRDDVFGIEWFQGQQTSFVPENDLMVCPGITYVSLCERCEYRFQCWTTAGK